MKRNGYFACSLTAVYSYNLTTLFCADVFEVLFFARADVLKSGCPVVLSSDSMRMD